MGSHHDRLLPEGGLPQILCNSVLARIAKDLMPSASLCRILWAFLLMAILLSLPLTLLVKRLIQWSHESFPNVSVSAIQFRSISAK